MKRVDLRSKIIPTTIDNTGVDQSTGNKDFNTTDLIYLDSYNEQYDGKKTDEERRISATDYAQMNNAYMSDDYTTRTGKRTTLAYLRSFDRRTDLVFCVTKDGSLRPGYIQRGHNGLCPSLHYQLPSGTSAQDEGEELEKFDIREVKDLARKNDISYNTNW